MANGRFKQLGLKDIAKGKFFINGEELAATSFSFSINKNLQVIPGLFVEIEATSGITDKNFTIDVSVVEEKFTQTFNFVDQDVEDFQITLQYNLNGGLRTLTWTGCTLSGTDSTLSPDSQTITLSGIFRQFRQS